MGKHQSQLAPAENKFHAGNGDDGKHYWITPPEVYQRLDAAYRFTFDPCPCPLPEGFDGLTCEWGASNYVNPPFGSIIHQGKKKGPTAWARKAIAESQKGRRVVLVYPLDKWVLMLLAAGARVTNLGDVRWLATEDGSAGKGTGRHIACFVLEPSLPTHGATMSDKLKPCPFCGGDPEHDPQLDTGALMSIWCASCGTDGPESDSREGAVAAWNHRALPEGENAGGGEAEDEAYEIGKRDGYGEAVQDIDLATGGDGEYRFCTDHDPERHVPDESAMIKRIVERVATLKGGGAR